MLPGGVGHFLPMAVSMLSVACYEKGNVHLKLGLMLPSKHIRLGWDINAAAATIAIDKAREDGVMDGYNISLIYRDDGCDAKIGSGIAVDLWAAEHIDAFIGPPCSVATISVGYLASYWNVPLFSQASTDPKLSDKAMYDTLVRMGPPFTKMGLAFIKLFRYFDWRRAVMVSRLPVGSKFVFCDFASRSIEEVFRDNNIIIADWIKISDDITEKQILDILERIKYRGRIVIVCASDPVEHRLLELADREGMAQAGYLYITLDHLPPANMQTPWGKNTHLMHIYKHVIQITVADLMGENVDEFLALVPVKMAEEPWNYNGTLIEDKKGSEYSAFLHDIMYLYLLTVNYTLSRGQDPRDGRVMFANSRSQTFTGITGSVKMDEMADRQPNYWLWQLNEEGTAYEVWTEISLDPLSGEELVTDDSAPKITFGGHHLTDTPLCGFRGELCLKDKTGLITGFIIGFVMLILLVIGGFITYRRRKLHEEIRNMLWRVKYEDLQFVKSSKAGSSSQMLSQMSMYRSVTSTNISVMNDLHQGEANVASYQGVIVAVHRINAKHITLQAPDYVHLNNLRQMNHENVTNFIGACVDAPNVCVLSTFCPRGSLQDILENDDIKLDWLFKSSLVTDLCNGMLFIHSSVLEYHGSLTSDNCMIDNRWILKVAKTGLHSLYKFHEENEQMEEYQKYREQLWTAPEILRCQVDKGPLCGTAKGDVYSFGIILQEILQRAMPFGHIDISPKEIIERIKDGSKGEPFRPTIYCDNLAPHENDYVELMKACWNEEPEARPAFIEIRKTIRNFNKGKKINIVDNMLNMMEKYANNLEDIVTQRTSELMDEKKKTDSLLFRMLPRTVAEELKHGRTVPPEMYSQVTIFFSDIVGFTALSSESTPIQVVDLLNDLYTLFDDIIEMHDVYKVETIGDAYMVVSGLPVSNGDQHAAEIANMALDLLSSVYTNFHIKHLPQRALLLRTGIHTGPCAAGVVGLTMPRYCLFGDTVNTTSRMESTGEALKIHLSREAHDALCKLEGYQMIKRGEIQVKGKGLQTTYWLRGKDGFSKKMPII